MPPPRGPRNDHPPLPPSVDDVVSKAMAHPKKDPPLALELRLTEAATPERVEATARMFRQMLAVVHPGLPPDAVTMIVTNKSMGAGLRPWSKDAIAAAKSVVAFARAPVGYLKKHPQQLELATVVREYVKTTESANGAQLWHRGAKKATAHLNTAFVERVERHREKVEATAARSVLVAFTTTSVRSCVLRVGKVAEGKPVCARINLEGEVRDVPIEGPAGPFFDAARDEGLYRIRLRIAWRHDRNGEKRVDAERSSLFALTRLEPPLRGEHLVRALTEATPTLQGMTNDEIEERLDQIRGG